MFSFRKSKDIITLFHKASNPASVRVATALKQASANATAAATEDQASNGPIKHRAEFDLNITEDPPTSDQIQTILGYVGQSGIPNIIKGARTENEAMRKFKESVDNFQRPVTVDWNNGRAVAGSDESVILKMVNAIQKEDQ